MTFEEDYVEATVYSTVKAKNGDDIHFVKVSFIDVGFYINSITVRKSLKYPDKGWWVQPPKLYAKGTWKQHLEFKNDSPLWKLIEELAIKAVDEYLHENKDPPKPNSY